MTIYNNPSHITNHIPEVFYEQPKKPKVYEIIDRKIIIKFGPLPEINTETILTRKECKQLVDSKKTTTEFEIERTKNLQEASRALFEVHKSHISHFRFSQDQYTPKAREQNQIVLKEVETVIQIFSKSAIKYLELPIIRKELYCSQAFANNSARYFSFILDGLNNSLELIQRVNDCSKIIDKSDPGRAKITVAKIKEVLSKSKFQDPLKKFPPVIGKSHHEEEIQDNLNKIEKV